MTAAGRDAAARPRWLRPAAWTRLGEHPAPTFFGRFPPPDEGGRRSAVLMLFGAVAGRRARTSC